MKIWLEITSTTHGVAWSDLIFAKSFGAFLDLHWVLSMLWKFDWKLYQQHVVLLDLI